MKFGIIYCGYNVSEYIRDSLQNFVDDQDFVISAVSVPFKEYEKQQLSTDDSTHILRDYLSEGKIKYLVDAPKYILESEARNLALQNLEKDNVDYYWLVDGDEIYSKRDIFSIKTYVEKTKSFWYKVCLKNFVFDKNTYMEEPFCPPRIFTRLKGGYFNPKFYWDNDIEYQKVGFTINFSYKTITHRVIPQDVAWVNHYTWLDNEASKSKCEYQLSHFGHSSFKWEDGHLKFDDSYFKKTGEKKPNLING